MFKYLHKIRVRLDKNNMKKIICLILGLFLVSCTQDSLDERPLDELYNEAMDNMLQGHYMKAANLFEAVEIQYPYNNWAKKAQIMQGYC